MKEVGAEHKLKHAETKDSNTESLAKAQLLKSVEGEHKLKQATSPAPADKAMVEAQTQMAIKNHTRRASLKPTTTAVKNTLPTAEDIKAEREGTDAAAAAAAE